MELRLWEYKMGVSQLDLPRLMESERPDGDTILIRWGQSAKPQWDEKVAKVFNHAEAVCRTVDKPKMLTILESEGLKVPSIELVDKGFVVKPVNHKGGKGIKVFREGEAYIEGYVEVESEYRVFVVKRRSIVRQKVGGSGEVRNRRHGWVTSRPAHLPERLDQLLRTTSFDAVHALGLDFGAVDVGLTPDSKVIVYEVNSGPRLTAEFVRNWFQNRLLEVSGMKREEEGVFNLDDED